MADEYPVLTGIVQKFKDKDAVVDREVEVDGEEMIVREFTVKATGSQALVRISLWPQWEGVEIEDGDFIAANGKFTSSEGKDRTFYNLAPFVLHVNGQKQTAERDEKQASKSNKSSASKRESAPF